MYFLTDGIYPLWSIFVKSIALAVGEAEKNFSKRHKRVRKDIERCLEVLVSKFKILERPLRRWFMDVKTMVDCCIILHNMVIEFCRENFIHTDLREDFEQEVKIDDDGDESIFPENENELIEGRINIAALFAARVSHLLNSIEEHDMHVNLQNDLLHHITNHYYN